MTFGLYIHIPFCSQICHYCDFAKTSNYTDAHAARYFSRLAEDLKLWLSYYTGQNTPLFSSVFFGGGTPGLFTREYLPIFHQLRPHLAPHAEISLEANPQNISHEHLQFWRDLGFNRLSIGVQTFHSQGLAYLHRDHDTHAIERALDASREVFSNINMDLIYGWNQQTLSDWHADLKLAVAAEVPHLSLYNLTYETSTPIGRSVHRGRTVPTGDDQLAEFFDMAANYLGASGFEHGEISNWARPGFHCQHNRLYWEEKYFVGLGIGAHGYLPATDPIGLRYRIPNNLKAYLEAPAAYASSLEQVIHGTAGVIDRSRSKDSWLLEYVGCGLRAATGISLARIQEVTGHSFRPNTVVQAGIDQGLLQRQDERLTLSSREWFRETAWSLAVADSFKKITES